ncbi:MAG: OmpA/MotB domain protein [Bacteroidota bacterium]|nr:OmpA/MotB domain protein [Bacteroidota bacterium]
MRKSCLLLIVSIAAVPIARGQFFLGLRGSPYGGITNVDYNPAIADNRFIVDINLIGVAANVNNNYVGIDRKVIFNHSLFNDPNFQADHLHERVNGRDKSAYVGAQIQGPLSFMFSFGKKKDRFKNAIAFSWHTNVISNADNVTEILARSAYYGMGNQADAVTHFLGKGLSNANLSVKSAAWNDFGITYSRVIINKGANMLKVGGTLKLLQPLGGAYGYAENLNYKWPEVDMLSIYKAHINYAYSEGLISSKGYSPQNILQTLSGYQQNLFSYKYASPTVAVDIGLVYEWRPDKTKYNKELDCNCKTANERDKYKVAMGFSIIDFGALRFKRGQYSQNIYADIQNWDVSNVKFPNGLQSLDDTIHSRFQVLPGKNYFTIWLPTRFNLFLDYNIIKDFGIIFSAMVSPDMSPNHSMIHQVTTFTINPKYENKWFGVYLPVSYDVMRNVSLGATLRIGPLIVGTEDLLCLFAKKYVYNADIHAALKITIPDHKICRKGDMRFNGQLY